MSEFGRKFELRKLRVNIGMSKVMGAQGIEMRVECMILNSEPLEEVNCFKYLGSQLAADGGCERDVVHRRNE